MNTLTLSRPPQKAPDQMAPHDANARIDTHEAVCAERYAGINARLRRMEGWLVTMVCSVMAMMASIILKGLH